MLSGLPSTLSSLLAQPGLLAIGAGLLAGAITGSTLVVTGTLPSRPAPQLVLRECPDAGRDVARVDAGVSILVTGRNPDGTWVELYVGVPGIDRGWAPASAVKAQATLDTLPVVQCVVAPLASAVPPGTTGPTIGSTPAPSVVATVLPSVSAEPSPGPTATPKPSPSAKPTATPAPTPVPTPTPTPAPTPDVFAPLVSAPSITSPGPFGNGSYYIGVLPCAPSSATIHVTASDPSGLNWVRLYYRRPTETTLYYGTMSALGGGVYEYVITPNNTWLDGEIGLWAAAQDTHGNTTGLVPFGDPNSSSDVSLFWSAFCIP
jgi:hypothetical protein